MFNISSPLMRLCRPWAPLVGLLIAGIILLSLSRLGLVIWQWDRVIAQKALTTVLLQGLRVDLIQMGLWLLPLSLLAPLIAHDKTWRLWRWSLIIWGSLTLTVLAFMEASTPAFIQQYDLRPNRLFIEYLQYPQEVVSTLWHGFKLPLILGLSLTLCVLMITWRTLKRRLPHHPPKGHSIRLLMTWPLVILLLAGMIRSTTEHRPANPAMFALTADPLVNSLILDSTWSVEFALYNLQHEAHSSSIYGHLSDQAMLATLRHGDMPWLNPNASLPTLHTQTATYARAKPLNLVIILEESLGAGFVQSLGGQALTPELESLKSQGWWFENLYATGTRSVRGIEAVVSGFMPTPARSVVKLSLAQRHFFTLADLLKQQGYHTEFIYGGEAHFDNMRSFFTGNGFDQVVDQNDYKNPIFTGSWGVSDEDLFHKTDQRLQQHTQSGQPLFTLVFSSSNHEPFEYPSGRIQPEGPIHSVHNAVRYADYALGQFFNQAKQRDYWHNTLFLVVADHDVRVYGNELVPIKHFHIPGLIVGADIQPQQIKSITSQIDLPPTLLSLMGINSQHPMPGRDMTQAAQQAAPGRAIMQFADNWALMRGQAVTILQPEKPALAGRYDPTTQSLTLTGTASSTQSRDALAHALLPAWLYQQRRYHLQADQPPILAQQALE